MFEKNEELCFIGFKTRSVAECFKPDKTHAANVLISFKTVLVGLLICRIILGFIIFFFWRNSAAKFSHVFIKFKDTH